MPRVGDRAQIRHFGGEREAATILVLHEHGRRLEVQAASGERLQFVLNAATARFVQAGTAHGARLDILGP